MSEERWRVGFNEWHLCEALFIACDGAEPVAYVSSEAFPHEFEDRGWRHAWIDGVGTVRSHRKRGVDSENPTGAYGVYEDLGFVKMRREVMVSKTA